MAEALPPESVLLCATGEGRPGPGPLQRAVKRPVAGGRSTGLGCRRGRPDAVGVERALQCRPEARRGFGSGDTVGRQIRIRLRIRSFVVDPREAKGVLKASLAHSRVLGRSRIMF